MTWIKYQFHGDTYPIEFYVPNYVVDMWINEKSLKRANELKNKLENL